MCIIKHELVNGIPLDISLVSHATLTLLSSSAQSSSSFFNKHKHEMSQDHSQNSNHLDTNLKNRITNPKSACQLPIFRIPVAFNERYSGGSQSFPLKYAFCVLQDYLVQKRSESDDKLTCLFLSYLSSYDAQAFRNLCSDKETTNIVPISLHAWLNDKSP
jgi:hypothetical protein